MADGSAGRPEPAVAAGRAARPLLGMGLAALAYGLFCLQDAIVKWLVATHAVPQILFVRSLAIMLATVVVARPAGLAALAHSPAKGNLVLRAVLILLAWLTYYTAARSMGLAELTTLYFAAPVMTVALSRPILGERPGPVRWLAVLGGFAGVLLAAGPATGAVGLLPAALVLVAALCWSGSTILVRLVSRTETTASQMIVSNGLFALGCLPALPFDWVTPTPGAMALMLGLAAAGGAGQVALYEGFRFAPASAVAPMEYTGLIWAFGLGYLVWHDVPAPAVFAGAGLIMASSLGLVWYEARTSRRGGTGLAAAGGPPGAP